jgi:iron complex outermembrane receptor protein
MSWLRAAAAVAAVFFALRVPCLWAEDPPGEKRHVLEAMTVTARRLPEEIQTGDVDKETTPGFYTTIGRDSFAGKMESLAGAVEREAGIQVRQSGGLGGFSTVSLRGSESDQVMVFLDGILLNDASGGGVDISNISLADVAGVDIYRGVTPVNFGKASIGGVVNVRTARSKGEFASSAGLGCGAFTTQKAYGLLSHKPGAFDYLFSADYLASGNDFTFTNRNGTPWNTADDREEKRRNAEFGQANLLAKCGLDVSRRTRLDVMNQYFRKDQNLSNWINLDSADTSFDTRRNIATCKITADDLASQGINLALSASHLWKLERYDDSQGSVGLGKQENEYLTQRLSGSVFAEWLTDHNILSLTTGTARETYKPRNLLQKENPRDSVRNTTDAAIQDSVLLFNDRLIITPAFRHVWLKDEMEEGSTVWGAPLAKETRKAGHSMPQIGVKGVPFQWLVLKTNLALYAREPSFFELFGDRGFFIGNDALVAEEGVNKDAGFEINLLAEEHCVNRVSFSMAVFHNNAENLITRIYDARGVGKSVNISKSEITGVETQAAVDLFQRVTVSGNLTWQDPVQDNKEIPAFDGKRLPGRYEYACLGKLEFRRRGFTAYTEYLYENGVFYDSANLVEAPEKKELNAGVSCTWSGFTLELEGRNLRDREYEDFNGYPLPGRAFYLTLRHEYSL